MTSRLERFEVSDPVHGRVPCTALVPAGPFAERLCLFLYGGGGSAELLAQLQPLFDGWWASGALPPLAIATPDVGPFSFYLDDPARGLGWESFVATRFIAAVRARLACQARPALLGISMGGYGALKIAFARPSEFAAVASISPMIEPAFEADQVRPRNCFHYPPDVPQALLGLSRDAALYRSDAPVARARRNAAELRQAKLPIWIDAAGRDAFNAHDGAEFLHRVLWELDVPHDYRLRAEADHSGPDFVARMLEAFDWAATRLGAHPNAPLDAHELAWSRWLDGRSPTPPSAPPTPASPLFPRWLRAQVADARAAATRIDPTLARHYGILPAIEPEGT